MDTVMTTFLVFATCAAFYGLGILWERGSQAKREALAAREAHLRLYRRQR